jgi:iron complex outermembrane receptor protein
LERSVRLLARSLLLGLLLGGALAHAAQPLEEVLVTGDASVIERQDGVAAVSVLDEDVLELVRQNHIYETMVRVPGVWISRGSGQEHLTAIRSPVLTGAGACGEFLFLENGVPIRPVGFCNVNNLFELNTEQAAALEVVRGPGGAVFGGNAVHGVINAVTHMDPGPWRVSLEGGSYEYGQLRVSGAQQTDLGRVVLDANATHTDGYRHDTGYDQQKVNLGVIGEVAGWQVHTLIAGTNLDQDTGGFVQGFEAYKDGQLRKTNPNPEAYRDAWAVRLTSEWSKVLDDERTLVLTPYLRRSDMEFLQHFLPGQPLEKNDQTSAGLISTISGTGGANGALDWRIGGHLEWADGSLTQFQDGPTEGSAFLQETRPAGLHYDYDVRSLMAAAFYDLDWRMTPTLSLVHGLRFEWLNYDYENHGLVGNTRDDGTECGFGGCLYTRPADREDDFTNVAGRLGLEWSAAADTTLYAQIGSGFRPPQATELYRLQSGQTVADLDSEQIWSVELGARQNWSVVDLELTLFAERSDDVILRDADGFNISDGKTESWGTEFSVAWAASDVHSFNLAGTYARHQYAFDRDAARGEQIRDGNDVDTAPRWLGSAQWRYEIRPQLVSELEFIYLDEYYLNAANTAEYDGHEVVNWRATWQINARLRTFARVLNVLDREYADRADFAFGSYRYFPAMPRQFYLGFEYSF